MIPFLVDLIVRIFKPEGSFIYKRVAEVLKLKQYKTPLRKKEK